MVNQKIRTVWTNGQVVIPVKFRKILGIEPGSKVLMQSDEVKKRIVIKPLEDKNHKFI